MERPRELGNIRPMQTYQDEDDNTDELEESLGPVEESGETISEDEEIEENVLEDMEKFEASFKNISQRYRLINRIGEGTFSTVYKAEDLLYDHYQNDWDPTNDKENIDQQQQQQKPIRRKSAPKYVAIKKIYVTSSPLRILNELDLLNDLRDAPNVCPLITAFRYQDQVIAILPFFQHKDFRDYYRDFTVPDMRIYLHSLFTALEATHEAAIIHRDIKPTNFLYSPSERRGVLVDFGLAEREGTDFHTCLCCFEPADQAAKISNSVHNSKLTALAAAGQSRVPVPAYPSNDTRSSRRANRAGTRGFRAPEVLLKCTAQTCHIDIWSCGIILLTFLSKRFPFFHSADDIDAFLELCCIFGRKRMRDAALLHGQILETNIPTVSENGHNWEKILLWCTSRSKRDLATGKGGLDAEELEAVEFMAGCLELNPAKRLSATEALQHPFLAGGTEGVAPGQDQWMAEG